MEDFIVAVKELWRQKEVVDDIKDKLGSESKKFEAMKSNAVKALEAMEIDKQHVPGCGTIFKQKSFSVKTPKDPESKRALFGWIAENKGQDVLDNLLSINSMTHNSLYKSELEVAKEEGNVDFALPGIETPEVYYKLGMRKG